MAVAVVDIFVVFASDDFPSKPKFDRRSVALSAVSVLRLRGCERVALVRADLWLRVCLLRCCFHLENVLLGISSYGNNG